MKSFLRFVAGVAALPACFAFSRAFCDVLSLAAHSRGVFSTETLSLLAGIAVFSLAWLALPHPVRAYVFAHELTHALWGIAFGAKASRLRVSAKGGSVDLTKSNFLITLAPYFFPFYTMMVILVASIVYWCAGRLALLSLWLFAIGFTWAFHVLFTLDMLFQRQSDISLYGRVFSWTFIYIANISLVLAWLAWAHSLSASGLWQIVSSRNVEAYSWLWNMLKLHLLSHFR